jgi:hypothetical protein
MVRTSSGVTAVGSSVSFFRKRSATRSFSEIGAVSASSRIWSTSSLFLRAFAATAA